MSLAHSCQRSVLVSIFFILFSTSIASPAAPASENKPHWILVSSSHFSVLTDADEKKANAVLLRMEQMRIVFGQLLSRTQLTMSEPLDIIAFNTREEYVQFSPVRDGQPITTSGFLLPGKDRNFIGLDLSDDESWRAISLPLARIYLNYNYPPTEAWFDDGFAEYFSSLRLSDTKASIGADPASFISQLVSMPWLPLPKLFAVTPDDHGSVPSIFSAQSWITMHYLLQQNKLSETGTYMGLVEARNVAVPEAVQQAYGSSVAQFEQSLKDYFRSVTPLLQIAERPQVPASGAAHGPIHQSSAPLTPLDVGTSILRLQEFEAQARVDELAVRIPERREQAVKDLQSLITLPKEETAIAHRALAWVHMQKRDYDDAFEELASAAELDPADPWVHYYLALAKYQQATETGNPIQGLANMMQDLRRVTDWNRDFAEAYNMLAMAQLQGGGLHAAADSMRPAIQLNPRSETYLLNLARIYLEGKKWDDATALLDRLKSSHDSQIARAAQQHLHDLPMLKKYGIPPQENPQAAAAPTPVLSNNTEDAYAGAEPPESAPAEAGPDLRKTQFLRGTLLGVDCSQPPAAIVKLSGGGKTLQLRTEDCRSLLVIGAGAFSCDWKNVAVQVNYKAGGKANGDLVSLEIR